MVAVLYAFSFCLLSKEELRAASSQVLQGRSSSLGPEGTSTPRQGTALTPLCLQHPICKHSPAGSLWLGRGRNSQEGSLVCRKHSEGVERPRETHRPDR